jgi:hypothetical protein
MKQQLRFLGLDVYAKNIALAEGTGGRAVIDLPLPKPPINLLRLKARRETGGSREGQSSQRMETAKRGGC